MRRIIKRALAINEGRGLEIARALLGNEKGESTMVFSYNPEDANSSWPQGDYPATITKVEESETKQNSDPMLVVRFKVHNGPNGVKQDLTDYIVNPPKNSGRKGSLFRLRSIAIALDMYEDFKAGTLRPKTLVDKNLTLSLGRKIDPKFGDQNTIDAYGKPQAHAVAVGAEDDDVPF